MKRITLLVDRNWAGVPHSAGSTLVHVSSVKFATLLMQRYPPHEIRGLYRSALTDTEFNRSETVREIIQMALDASDYRGRGLNPADVDTLFVDPETLQKYGIYDATLKWAKERRMTYVPLRKAA